MLNNAKSVGPGFLRISKAKLNLFLNIPDIHPLMTEHHYDAIKHGLHYQ